MSSPLRLDLDGDGYFPVYEPSAERAAAIEEAARETHLAKFYDAGSEVRAKGAANYGFSHDLEERARQQEELKTMRHETQKERLQTGAVDASSSSADPFAQLETEKHLLSGAMAQWERDADARREVIAQKKRKKDAAKEADADLFLAGPERELQ